MNQKYVVSGSVKPSDSRPGDIVFDIQDDRFFIRTAHGWEIIDTLNKPVEKPPEPTLPNGLFGVLVGAMGLAGMKKAGTASVSRRRFLRFGRFDD